MVNRNGIVISSFKCKRLICAERSTVVVSIFFYLQSEQTGHVYLARQIVSINYNDKYLPHTFAR